MKSLLMAVVFLASVPCFAGTSDVAQPNVSPPNASSPNVDMQNNASITPAGADRSMMNTVNPRSDAARPNTDGMNYVNPKSDAARPNKDMIDTVKPDPAN